MLSYKRFVKISQGIVGALAEGPTETSPAADWTPDTITGVRTGGILAVQLYAAAFADELGIDQNDLFEEIGLPRQALGNGGEARLAKITQNSRIPDDDSVTELLRRNA